MSIVPRLFSTGAGRSYRDGGVLGWKTARGRASATSVYVSRVVIRSRVTLFGARILVARFRSIVRHYWCRGGPIAVSSLSHKKNL